MTKYLFPLLIALIICVWIYMLFDWGNCNEAGGEYVRKMNGTYTCMMEDR